MAKARREKGSREVAPWRPFGDLAHWEREMDRRFGDLFDRRFRPLRGGRWWPARELGMGAPAVDVFEEKGEIVAKADLPGIEKDEVEVNVSDHRLTIQGEKKKEQETKEENYYYAERSYGSFCRSIDLPEGVDTAKAKASFKNGVLEIRFPKTEEAKRKEIKIRVE